MIVSLIITLPNDNFHKTLNSFLNTFYLKIFVIRFFFHIYKEILIYLNKFYGQIFNQRRKTASGKN